MQPQNEQKKQFLNSSFVCFAWELENKHFLTYSLHSHSVLEGLPANETCMFFSVFGAESREEVWQLQKGNEDGGEHSMFRVGRGSA